MRKNGHTGTSVGLPRAPPRFGEHFQGFIRQWFGFPLRAVVPEELALRRAYRNCHRLKVTFSRPRTISVLESHNVLFFLKFELLLSLPLGLLASGLCFFIRSYPVLDSLWPRLRNLFVFFFFVFFFFCVTRALPLAIVLPF